MKQWLKRITHTLYIPKHQRPTDGNILRLLMPSVVGSVICMVCLAGSTWAWFTASISTLPQTIKTASYDITVSIADENSVLVSLDEPLQVEQTYKVTLTASGTADKFGGYCIVGCGDVMLYTAQLLPGHTLSFTLTPPETAAYTFTAVWGSHSGETDIKNGSTIGQKTGYFPLRKTPKRSRLRQTKASIWCDPAIRCGKSPSSMARPWRKSLHTTILTKTLYCRSDRKSKFHRRIMKSRRSLSLPHPGRRNRSRKLTNRPRRDRRVRHQSHQPATSLCKKVKTVYQANRHLCSVVKF